MFQLKESDKRHVLDVFRPEGVYIYLSNLLLRSAVSVYMD